MTPDRYSVVCSCTWRGCPYRTNHRKGPDLVRLLKDARTEPRTSFTHRLRRLGNWKVTVLLALAVAMMVALESFGWLYWMLLAVYAVQVTFGYWVGNWWSRSVDAQAERGPSWRRRDSRTEDGNRRGQL